MPKGRLRMNPRRSNIVTGRMPCRACLIQAVCVVLLIVGSTVSLSGVPQSAAPPSEHKRTPDYPQNDFTSDTAFSVTRVVDGDTIEIDHLGTRTSVRLIGVDTPETVHPRRPVEPYGREASSFLKNLLAGEEVYLRFGNEQADRYGRTLAYVFRAPEGLFVNLELVRQGYGRAYTSYPFVYMGLFEAYEIRAKRAKKGLWGVPPERR